MKKFILAAIMMLSFNQVAFAEEWHLSRTVSPKDDSVSHMAVLPSKDYVTKDWMMFLECDEGLGKPVDIGFLVGKAYIPGRLKMITWRTDKDVAKEEGWAVFQNKQLFRQNGDQYLRDWKDKQSLWISVESNDSFFDISEFVPTYLELKKRCKIN